MSLLIPKSTTGKTGTGEAITASGLTFNTLSGPGSSGDVSKIMSLAKQRQNQIEEYERRKRILEESTRAATNISSRFVEEKEDMDDKLKKFTVGLVTHDQFKAIKENLELNEAKMRYEESKEREKMLAERRKKIISKTGMKKLSFSLDYDKDDEDSGFDDQFDDEEEKKEDEKEEEEEDLLDGKDDKPSTSSSSSKTSTTNKSTSKSTSSSSSSSSSSSPSSSPSSPDLPRRIMKDPTAYTDFLPDEERRLAEEKEIAEIAKEYEEQTAKQKKRKLDVTYSLWDGSGHRRTITVEQGSTVGEFLRDVLKLEHEQKNFRFAKTWSVQDVMLVKEDVILPQHISFHDLIVRKARGKSGPLWNWDVHDDVRMESDATVEKNESHPAKVVDKKWYEQNKHIFPVNRWEYYDPSKSYETYTISDKLKEKKEIERKQLEELAREKAMTSILSKR